MAMDVTKIPAPTLLAALRGVLPGRFPLPGTGFFGRLAPAPAPAPVPGRLAAGGWRLFLPFPYPLPLPLPHRHRHPHPHPLPHPLPCLPPIPDPVSDFFRRIPPLCLVLTGEARRGPRTPRGSVSVSPSLECQGGERTSPRRSLAASPGSSNGIATRRLTSFRDEINWRHERREATASRTFATLPAVLDVHR
jgi:hypothetical protein